MSVARTERASGTWKESDDQETKVRHADTPDSNVAFDDRPITCFVKVPFTLLEALL